MKLDEAIINIIDRYFDEDTAILIFGSQANNKLIEKSKDLDLLVIGKTGYYRGVQNQKIQQYSVDITIIPHTNFEFFMLKEIHKETVSPMVHALHTGRIIRDNRGQLNFYKDFATFIFDNKKDIYGCSPERFSFHVEISKKYILDYKSRLKNSLESFMLLSQVIDSIINVELFFNLGWSLNGKTKIKLIQKVNSDLYQDLEKLISLENQKDAIMNFSVLDDYLAKYQEILENCRLPSLKTQYLWGDKIALRIYDKNNIRQLCELFSKFIVKDQCHLYYLNSPLKPYSDSYYQLVIKGETSFLEREIIPIVIKSKMKDNLLSSSHFPLVEIFNGGYDSTLISEDFYSWFCESLINTKDNRINNRMHEYDANYLMIIIISLYTSISVTFDKRSFFFQYLFDCWFPYSYYNTQIGMDEVDQIVKETLKSFDRLNRKNKKDVSKTLNYLNIEVLDDETISDLRNKIKELTTRTKECKIYVPSFEREILKSYSDNDMNLEFWYIYRRHLECTFSILNIEEKNWAYLIYLIKENTIS